MKQILVSLLLSAQLCVYATECDISSKPLRIYLCSRLTQKARDWNDEICKELYCDESLHLFRPQDVDLKDLRAYDMDYAAYHEDFKGICDSDLLLVLPPYGRDCAWEIGWFGGAQKVTIAYVEQAEEWLRDAMVMGGITAIVTSSQAAYEKLLENPLTVDKSHLIEGRKELATTIKQIYLQHSNN